jgi:hypothetical protein
MCEKVGRSCENVCAHSQWLRCAGDDLLILASDGLHEAIDGDEMFRIVQDEINRVRFP